MSQPASHPRTVFRACVVNAVRGGEALMQQLVKVTQSALTEEESQERNILRRNLLSDGLRLLNQHEPALVKGYSKWSFSLGVAAAFASAWVVFRRRLGYNAAEVLALALYCQAVFIALQMANQLPLVLAHSPELLKWHKQWSPWYMTALQALVFMLALRQFYLLDVRRDGWRLLAAGAMFAVLKWQATALYARGVVEFVLWQMGL